MEFTEIKKSLFGGYSKDDVIRYISELNEEHSAELSFKSEDYAELKGTTDTKISELSNRNKESANKISELEKKIAQLTGELADCIKSNDDMQCKYDTLFKETQELREKSDIISTAILNAEKCAGQLIDKANMNASELMLNAEKKVQAETSKFDKAQHYIKEAREEVLAVLRKIDDELRVTEDNLENKKSNINNTIPSDVESAEKFGVIPTRPWSKRA